MEEIIYSNGTNFRDGIISYDNHQVPNNSVYSDRLYQWDYKKYNSLCEEIFGESGQSFFSRKTEDVEKFLRLYIGNENLVLCRITQYENQSNGYPYWRFDYKI